MKLLTRLREEFTSITHELYGKEVEQETEYVYSEKYALDEKTVLMTLLRIF